MKHRILLICIFTILALSSLSAEHIGWETTAEAYKGRYGQTISFELPPNGIAKPVYGFGGFDWDSSIGSPAVQMGLFTYEDGGEVTILIKEGPEYIKYEGWNTTFVFLDAKGNVVKPDESTILFIDIPDEPFQPSRDPDPVYFTVSNQTGTTLSVTNECEYDIVELYMLSPKMETELDYSKELLQEIGRAHV